MNKVISCHLDLFVKWTHYRRDVTVAITDEAMITTLIK